MEVKQPRKINEHGDYVGLRAIRVIREVFFEFLNLGPMLQRERARATEALRRKAMRVNRKLSDMMRRATQGFKRAIQRSPFARQEQKQRDDLSLLWNQACIKYMLADLPGDEIRRRVNAELGFPPDFSPGRK
jgi:hypothetical protein